MKERSRIWRDVLALAKTCLIAWGETNAGVLKGAYLVVHSIFCETSAMKAHESILGRALVYNLRESLSL